MRKGLLGSLAGLLASTSLALAQVPSAIPGPVAFPLTSPPGLVVPEGRQAAPAWDESPAGGADGLWQGSGPQVWVSAEYLMWWFKKSPVPVPLATMAPEGSPAAFPGAIGNPDTTVVLGGQNVGTNLHSGGRFAVGFWLDNEQTIGVEGNYFFLAGRSVTQSVSTSGLPGSPFLTVPFFDVLGGQQAAAPLPNLFPQAGGSGSGAGHDSLAISNRLQGAELNALYNASSGRGLRLDLLGGFRWLSLREDLLFTTSTSSPPPTGIDPFVYNTADQFNTRNNFYGGQLGARLGFNSGTLSANCTAKVALGNMHQSVNVNGTATTDFYGGPGMPQTIPGGVFAQPSNMGNRSRDRFSVVPEVCANVGYQVTSWARISVGYTFLYASNVVRPGNQIDRGINPTQTAASQFTVANGVPPFGFGGPATGAARPEPRFEDSNFWAQGITLGLQFSY